MALQQPTYYSGFNLLNIGVPQITVTRGATTYAALTFAASKYFIPFSDGASVPYASFAAALQVSLNAAAAAAGDGATVWTVAWSHANTAFTISINAGTYTAVLDTLARAMLGFTGNLTPAAISFTSTIRPSYVIRPVNDSWASDKPDYDGSDRSYEEETDDGDAAGISKTAVGTFFDIRQLYEPRARIYILDAVGSAIPWTWQHLFAHAGATEPIVLASAPWTQSTVAYIAADIWAKFRIRAPAKFLPQRHVANRDTYYLVPLPCRLRQRLSF